MAEPQSETDFQYGTLGEQATSQSLEAIWAGQGSSPLAIHGRWLDAQGLDPERLTAIEVDISLVDEIAAGAACCSAVGICPPWGRDSMVH